MGIGEGSVLLTLLITNLDRFINYTFSTINDEPAKSVLPSNFCLLANANSPVRVLIHLETTICETSYDESLVFFLLGCGSFLGISWCAFDALDVCALAPSHKSECPSD